MQKINGIYCKTVEDEAAVYLDMALTMLEEILEGNRRQKTTVMIVPVGPTGQYPILAELVNRLRVPLHRVHFFNMDEYMTDAHTVISQDDPLSFYGRMKRDFYDRVNPALVMPEENRHFPQPGGEAEYDARIRELGGVDLCLGGLGINGHVAFNEPPEEDAPIALADFAALGTRVLRVSRETRAVNAFGYLRGDIGGMPPYCITVGMREILAARKVYIALNRSWQNGPLRHALYTEETSTIPATLLRRVPQLTYCMTKEIAAGVLPPATV